MDENQLLQTIKSYEEEYKRFMGVEDFPLYETKIQSISMEELEEKGYISAAKAEYEVSKNKHTLIVNSNLPLEKSLLFHEFTHILDADTHVKGDWKRNIGITLYMEYHASQVALMQLLGANSINETLCFSMDMIISPYGIEKSVSQYVKEKHQSAIELFSNDIVRNDLKSLLKAYGVLCNYWGLRSICKLYAKDYVEVIDNHTFLNHIPSLVFCQLNNLMQGWLDDNRIETSIKFLS